MTVRPAIPAIDGVKDKQLAGILGPMKMILDSITGRAPNRTQITPLSPNAGFAAMINKTNEIIARLQGNDIGTAPASVSGTGIFTNSLTADVALNNTANYFDGPSVAQGAAGTWIVAGRVTVKDTGGAADFLVKLWDGNTVIDSAFVSATSAATRWAVPLFGVLKSPAGNLRISVRDSTLTSGKILFNESGNSMDSTIIAFRIG